MAMDLVTSPTTGAPASTVTRNRTPDSDTETPPTPRPNRPHTHHHRHAPPEEAAGVVVSYKECMKNHAATTGGHALDGCCEFMPWPTANPLDPTSLKCAACGCHRNFHRRDPDDPTPLHHHPPARGTHSPPSASQLLLSLSGQSPSGPLDEMDPRVVSVSYFNGLSNSNKQRSKKRFRTKFSQEQKEKMQEFAERIGWRLRRGEERLVEEFCKSIGVGRAVFKVWMHNNKSTSSSSRREKIEQQQQEEEEQNHLHVHNLNHHSNGGSNNGNGNGNCGSVVYHEFYANNGPQEAQ